MSFSEISSPLPPPSFPDPGHLPVLPQAVLSLLNPQPGQIMLDATLGRAGHASLIAPLLGPTGRYLGLDVDPANLAFAQNRLAPFPCQKSFAHANFAQAREILDQFQIPAVNLLLADLGFASNQMDDPSRGFAFSHSGPLDMRLDPSLPTTAADLVNHLPEKELADLIYQYGEEKLSRRIARNIVERRKVSPILNTTDLAQEVRRAYGSRAHKERIHPATRTFMALRIAVNAELDALTALLQQIPRLLAPNAVAVIISFHSLEDRLVKHALQDWKLRKSAEILTKKPLSADEQESQSNPRSRSAKLRAFRWFSTGISSKAKYNRI